MARTETLETLRELTKRIGEYLSALYLHDWDKSTKMPPRGSDARANVMGMLTAERYKLQTSGEMRRLLEELEPVRDELDPADRRIVVLCRREYDRQTKIPAQRKEAFAILTARADAVWREARERSDFSLFAPALEQIVDMQREFADGWGYEDHPYDALLPGFEHGVSVRELDPLFRDLRRDTVALLRRVQNAPPIDTSPLTRFYEPERQRAFCEFLLGEMGYDFAAGRLDDTVHPFAQPVAAGDVRVTTRYLPHFINTALFGAIHEGGHALYDQNIDPAYRDTPVFEGASMGIHESQSRFWENVVGRGRAFWERYYADLQKEFPGALGDVGADAFHAAVNAVEPSFIRVEADELTYNLHIMIRYEIEKGLVAGELRVRDLPEIWNTKMKDYLDITPPDDAQGVLQDIHWSMGSFGYFPSYTLGNLYAAQFTHALEQALPDMRERIARGELWPIREWLTEHIHRHGALYDPGELVARVTGEPLRARYLVEYLERKYASLYGI